MIDSWRKYGRVTWRIFRMLSYVQYGMFNTLSYIIFSGCYHMTSPCRIYIFALNFMIALKPSFHILNVVIALKPNFHIKLYDSTKTQFSHQAGSVGDNIKNQFSHFRFYDSIFWIAVKPNFNILDFVNASKPNFHIKLSNRIKTQFSYFRFSDSII